MSRHIKHIEDLMLEDGGAYHTHRIFQDMATLLEIRGGFARRPSSALDVTLKWDGAPSVFCGRDPHGAFFVATKALLNKKPVLYRTTTDIAAAPLEKDVQTILTYLFRHMKDVEFDGSIIQGDVMFTKFGQFDEVIDGVSYTTFQENTIVYGVPTGTAIAKRIDDAEIGVFFHSTYDYATFPASITEIDRKSHVSIRRQRMLSPTKIWIETSDVGSSPQTLTLTYDEMVRYHQDLRKIETLNSNPDLKKLFAEKQIVRLLEYFVNAWAKTEVKKLAPREFVTWHNARVRSHVEELLTERGKAAAVQRSARLNQFVLVHQDVFQSLFDAYLAASRMKRFLVNKLDQGSAYGTFYRQHASLVRTSHEGYVVFDKRSMLTVKIVDREGFSRLNFSDEVHKAWTPKKHRAHA